MTVQSRLDKALENLPEGVAAYFLHGDPAESFRDTVCVLVKAEGKKNHKLPRTARKYETLAAGIAFYTEGDTVDNEKAELIALGRALKAYNKGESPKNVWIAGMSMQSGHLVWTK